MSMERSTGVSGQPVCSNTTLATTITGVRGLTTVEYWSTAQCGGGAAGGGWRQLADNATDSNVTAICAASNAIWRSCWHLEALEEKKEEEKVQQQGRQREHNNTAMVEAAEKHCSPEQMWVQRQRQKERRQW